jgi:hypothetical protein
MTPALHRRRLFGVPVWIIALMIVPVVFSLWSVDLIWSVSRLRTAVEQDVAITAKLGALERRLASQGDPIAILSDRAAVVTLIESANADGNGPSIDTSALRAAAGNREILEAVGAATASVRARLTQLSGSLGRKWEQLNGLAAGAVALTFTVCVLLVTSDRAHAQRKQLVDDLQQTLAEVKSLQRMLPICSYCKRIRDDQNYWLEVEKYITLHGGTRFSHSVCPACYERVVEPQLDISKL